MNEMDLLHRLRDEVPPQTDLRAEETRLLAAVRSGEQAPTRPVRRPPRRLRLGMALAGAFGLAAVTLTVTQTGEPAAPPGPARAGEPASPRADVATVLERAALVAEKSPTPAVRPDQWFYIKETQPGTPLPTFELWSRMDGSKEAIREEGGELKIGDGEKGPTNPLRTQAEVESFPDDPDALLTHLRALKRPRHAASICQPDCPPGTEKDVAVFGALQWYIKYGPIIPPDKRAVMYRAMAMIPNVKIEDTTTAEGRPGIGVALDLGEAGKGYTILDPETYRYLGHKVVRTDMTFAMSVLDSGVVDEPGQVPSP
ncbi:CU044_5270 family protein [Nonomuraea sp. NPDC047897]|uniref:CU044_5270 family protein n=1 Tax=Nonomuraea sp. NPDC047897 TaxID=3364346 RepID=UPI003723BB34